MPLTPAHAAAAWPISRWSRRLPLDALVVGTMSPDFEYLLRVKPEGFISHSLEGLIVFCLPVGLLVWMLFRALVRPALLELFPPALASELSVPRSGQYAWAVLAILLGALSHLAWDSFTHAYGWFVKHSALLRSELDVGPLHYPAYRWLQHASSVAGLLIITCWIVRWVRRRPTDARRFAPGQASRLVRFMTVLPGFAAVCAVLNGLRVDRPNAGLILGYVAVGAMDGLAVALLAFGVARASRSRP